MSHCSSRFHRAKFHRINEYSVNMPWECPILIRGGSRPTGFGLSTLTSCIGISHAAKLQWFFWALALREGTPYLNNSQDGNLILQRLLALPLRPTSVKKRLRTDFGPSVMGEGIGDTFPDNPERRGFSDHGVKRLKVDYDGDSGSPGISTKITPLSGLAAGPLDPTGGKLKPLTQLVKGASHRGSETVSLIQDANVSPNPPFDNQAEASVLKCRAMSDITRNMTARQSSQSSQASPVSTRDGFQELHYMRELSSKRDTTSRSSMVVKYAEVGTACLEYTGWTASRQDTPSQFGLRRR